MKKLMLAVMLMSVMLVTQTVFGEEVAAQTSGGFMAWIQGTIGWVMQNGAGLLQACEMLVGALIGLLGVAEVITRMTKTEKDDAFIERMGEGVKKAGSVVKKAMDFLKVPNRQK